MPKVLSGGSGSGRGRGRRTAPTLAEINVVPLVDVMLVLLIIFMVAAPMLQRGIDVKLPVASRSQEIASERLFVSVPISYQTDKRVYVGEDSVPQAVLGERVRQLLVNRTDRQVFLRGDGGIRYDEFMTIVDILKRAGVENVGLVTALPGER
ncbi:MAG: biopolymer transporter ExbD [Vicinamibacterales bacterium]